MVLKAIVDNLDNVPEPIKEHYKEQDGKFILDVESVNNVELADNSKLKSALGKERQNIENLRKRLEAYEGIEDPSAALEALTKVKEMENWTPEEKVQQLIESKTKQLTDMFNEEKITLSSERDTFVKELEKLLVDEACTKALVSAGVGDNLELIHPHVKKYVRMELAKDAESNQVSPKVKVIDPETGTELYADSQGNPHTIPSVVDTIIKKKFPIAFKPSGASGTNSNTSSVNSGDGVRRETANTDRFAGLSPTEKLKLARREMAGRQGSS